MSESISSRPFGRLTQSTLRKAFFYLLTTLNAAFPNNDFEDVRSEQFLKMPSVEIVMDSASTSLFNIANHFAVNKNR